LLSARVSVQTITEHRLNREGQRPLKGQTRRLTLDTAGWSPIFQVCASLLSLVLVMTLGRFDYGDR
jgi:hypothetical protein